MDRFAKFGGRSRSRTYDLAHVRHDANVDTLLELLAEILLGANAGGNDES
jgi:hypothetical protein